MPNRHEADFAAKVDALYARTVARQPFDARGEQRDVREVAFALAQIRTLIEDGIGRAGLRGLPETALVAASDLLDSLINGTSHPIWQYIREGKSRKRANKAPASKIDALRRAIVVGILRSLQNDAQLSRRDAAQKLAECAPAIDAVLTSDQVIGWDKSFSEHEDNAPDAFRSDLLRLAGSGPYSEETILRIGLGRAYFLWRLPDGLKAPALSPTQKAEN
jgi:hypothetical protein